MSNLIKEIDDLVVLTGAAGFIGSCLLKDLNAKGVTNILLVDDFSNAAKHINFNNKKFTEKIDRTIFLNWFEQSFDTVKKVYHIGARTDTSEFDTKIFKELNLNYSKSIWNVCSEANIPLIYASSAATYGNGDHGYKDDHSIVNELKPLNPYGESKNDFDRWTLQQENQPPFWAGLKFFNVYGPNEYHKGRMASVIFHAYNQIKETGKMKLFRSHNSNYKDGEQLRDFIYVKDLTDVCTYLMKEQPKSGLYNIGTGTARTFIDLVTAVFDSLDVSPVIDFIDTPEDIRDKYQYFTEADMHKLKSTGYLKEFTSLEEGVKEYVQEYLVPNEYY